MSRLLVPLLLLILSQVGCSVESEIEAPAAAPTDQNATLMAQARNNIRCSINWRDMRWFIMKIL